MKTDPLHIEITYKILHFLFLCLVLYSLLLFIAFIDHGYHDDAFALSFMTVIIITIQNCIPFVIFFSFTSIPLWVRCSIWVIFILVISCFGLKLHFSGGEGSGVGIPILLVSISSPVAVLLIFSQHKKKWYFFTGIFLFVTGAVLSVPIARF